MNLKQVKEFKEQYEAFLRGSNANLGRETKKKEAFVAGAMKLVMDFVFDASGSNQSETTEQDESKSSSISEDRCLSMKPTKENRLVGPKGVAAMTGPESKRADEELGTSRSVE